MKPLRWGIMGLDCIAGEFAEHLLKNGRVFSAASEDEKELGAFVEKYPACRPVAGLKRLATDGEVDIVYVSTFGSSHYENIMECLEGGKHVLCEKSMFQTREQALKASALAEEKGLFLGEAMTIYYMPLFEKIREMMDEGVLGKIKMLRADFGSLKDPAKDPLLFSPSRGGGAMYDIGTYALTFVLSFMSALPSSDTFIMKCHETGADEMWNIILKNDNMELANINLSFRAKLPKRAIIAGDKAYILLYDYNRADRATLVYPDGREKEIEAGDRNLAVTYEILGAEQAVAGKDFMSSRMDLTVEAAGLMEKFLKAACKTDERKENDV